jgi:hypothetical protein
MVIPDPVEATEGEEQERHVDRTVPERAMDLENEKGKVVVQMLGHYRMHAETKGDPGNDFTGVNVGWATVNTYLLLSGQPLFQAVGLVSFSTQGVFGMLASADIGMDGSSRAEITRVQKAFRRPDVGTSFGAEPDTLVEQNGGPGTTRKNGHQEVKCFEELVVGQQFSAWVDIVTQAQLKSRDGSAWTTAWATWLPESGDEGTVRLKIVGK